MRRIARRLLDELDAIVERLGDRYREVPEYAALSDRAMRAEVLPMSRQVVATFLAALGLPAHEVEAELQRALAVARQHGARAFERRVRETLAERSLSHHRAV